MQQFDDCRSKKVLERLKEIRSGPVSSLSLAVKEAHRIDLLIKTCIHDKEKVAKE